MHAVPASIEYGRVWLQVPQAGQGQAESQAASRYLSPLPRYLSPLPRYLPPHAPLPTTPRPATYHPTQVLKLARAKLRLKRPAQGAVERLIVLDDGESHRCITVTFTVTLPLHLPLHYRYIAVTLPLHCRYIALTLPLY